MAEEIKKEPEQRCQHNHAVKIVLIIVGIVIVFAVIGSIGLAMKFKGRSNAKVNNFTQERGNRMGFSRGKMMQNFAGNRISGDITKIDGNTITLQNPDKTYTITVNDSTSYSKNGNIAKQSDMLVNNNIVISGTSDSQGNITATSIIIR